MINIDIKSKLLNMNRFQVLVLAMACCFLMACAVPGKRKVTTGSSNKKNVLFIAVDDLRPLLGAYGATQMKTPHIDSLIKDGVRFDNAYSNIAVCGASRASLISGIRPNAGRFSNYASWASEDVPGTKPLHAIFRENGYETVSLGKVVHHPEDFEEYWNRIDGRINHFQYNHPASIAIAAELQKTKKPNQNTLARQGPAYERAEVPDEAYTDGEVAGKAILELRRLKNTNKPFFLAVGFIGPHLPFIAPATYWDMYTADDIRLAENPYIPQYASATFIHNSAELRNMYTGIPDDDVLPDTLALKLVHGYYASVSYTDAMIGKVYNELEALGLKEHTIVVFWSDHGYLLGEHTMWNKHSTFNEAVRIPLAITAPGMSAGVHTASLAESVDIYPTLCDLAGINAPSYLHGQSLVPILKNPEAKVKDAIYTRYGNQEAVITKRYSWMEIVDAKGVVRDQLLFDMDRDPKQNINVSLLPENKRVVASLRKRLLKMRERVNQSPIP